MKVPRAGKFLYSGDLKVEKEGLDQLFRYVFQVTVRKSEKEGQILLMPDVEAETYDTSLQTSPKTIVELYHAHGTSEQFHSEIKSDLNLERLPSGKFLTNALVLLLGTVAYNCLRLVGRNPCGKKASPRKNVLRSEKRFLGVDFAA